MRALMRRYRVAILDLDGTLMDSGDAHFESWRRAFASHGREFTRSHWARLFGRNASDFLDLVMPEAAEGERRAVLEDKRRFFLGGEVQRVRLCPGARELFSAFARRGVAPYVASSSSRENVELMLSLNGLDAPVVSGAEVARGKPAPDIFLEALGRARADGHQGPAFVLEDSPFGVEAGVAAGIDTYAVLTGGSPREALAAAGALEVFEDAGGMARLLLGGRGSALVG
jgi:HAD superfamily hydrolase (TIGR01509 family)